MKIITYVYIAVAISLFIFIYFLIFLRPVVPKPIPMDPQFYNNNILVLTTDKNITNKKIDEIAQKDKGKVVMRKTDFKDRSIYSIRYPSSYGSKKIIDIIKKLKDIYDVQTVEEIVSAD